MSITEALTSLSKAIENDKDSYNKKQLYRIEAKFIMLEALLGCFADKLPNFNKR